MDHVGGILCHFHIHTLYDHFFGQGPRLCILSIHVRKGGGGPGFAGRVRVDRKSSTDPADDQELLF
jgi:hypothetical protein